MLIIPSVAKTTAIDKPVIGGNISFGQSLGIASNCLPTFTTPFNETRTFTWNVENSVHVAMSFSYYVGEGPLYWYRVDWYPSISTCHAPSCISVSPMINFIEPNCPYEIIESCIILPPTCSCTVSCIPGTCISQTVEVWHMLATSVTHLCERINQECCNRKPPGFMRRVRQYMRPALCCDVAKSGIGEDQYVDVNFLKCECGNLVDPCIATIIYPCDINFCGIHGPAFQGVTPSVISAMQMAPDLLGHMPLPIMQESVSALPANFEMVAPKAMLPTNSVTKYGSFIPERIKVNHNFGELNILKDFIRLNKIKFDSFDLFHNKGLNSWYGSQVLKEWKIMVEWTPLQNLYKLNISFDKGKIKSKVSLLVKEDFTNSGNFEIDCNLNIGSGTLDSKKAILKSKIVKDDIGLFKNVRNLKLILKG